MPVTFIWMFVYTMNFRAARSGKRWSFWLFRPNLRELGLFHPYFVCNFWMVILDQSKPISLILLLWSIAFMVNKSVSKISLLWSIIFFVRWRVKKLSTGVGNGGTILISSGKCNFSIYLDNQVYYFDIQVITTLLCLLLVFYLLIPSNHSFFYLTTALLKSYVFRHSKAYSHSF